MQVTLKTALSVALTVLCVSLLTVLILLALPRKAESPPRHLIIVVKETRKGTVLSDRWETLERRE